MVGYTVSAIVLIMRTGKIDMRMCMYQNIAWAKYGVKKILYHLEHTPGMHGDFSPPPYIPHQSLSQLLIRCPLLEPAAQT
jgi:hypothetical protein